MQLKDELIQVSHQFESLQVAFGKLEAQNAKLNDRLVIYQEAEKTLIQEVEKVKQDSANNQAEFERLFL